MTARTQDGPFWGIVGRTMAEQGLVVIPLGFAPGERFAIGFFAPIVPANDVKMTWADRNV